MGAKLASSIGRDESPPRFAAPRARERRAISIAASVLGFGRAQMPPLRDRRSDDRRADERGGRRADEVGKESGLQAPERRAAASAEDDHGHDAAAQRIGHQRLGERVAVYAPDAIARAEEEK